MTEADHRRLLPARFEALLPLLVVYFALAAVYSWQASERLTPTLFSDEIEFTQISRSIADTGRAALRGGDPAPGASLYEFVAAPAWWFDDVGTAYAAIKYLSVLLMTATLFPAYALARLFVSRRYALFAAIGAVAAPALSYSPFLVEEPLAYPVSTLALYLIARAAIAPTRPSIGLAFAGCIVGTLVRTQLAVLFVVLVLTLLARAWRRERTQAWRGTWSAGDWIGAAALVVGLAVFFSAAMGRYSFTWYVSTAFFKGRMFEYGVWAVGALAIGIGVVPLVAGLIALARPRREQPNERMDVFVAITVASLAAFVFYTAVKATYLSTYFAVVIAERNLIYVVPLLFIGTAIVLERRRPLLLATTAATALAAYLVTATPHSLSSYPNYEAHGLSIAALANRIFHWPAERIETALVLVAFASGLTLLALRLVRSPRVAASIGVVVAAFALTWSLTAEIYAANGERIASDRAYAVLATPPSWIDNLTGGERTALVGQGMSDPNPIWQLEFWNRSIEYFMGMDGSAPGPGQTATPNLDKPDGTLAPHDLGAAYAVAIGGVAIAAPQVATVGGMVLYRLGGKPVRLRETATGVAVDGWMAASATYTRYDVAGLGRGFVKVTFSRQGAGFPQLKPVRVAVRVGPVVVDPEDQPAIGNVTATGEGMLAAGQITPLLVPVPSVPWRAEVSVASTFVPHDLDPSLGDRRELGAVVSFEFVALDSG